MTDFQSNRQDELDRWSGWVQRLDNLEGLALTAVDTLNGMEAGSPGEPVPYSEREAADLLGMMLPLVLELAEHAHGSDGGARLLRNAADQLEE